MQTGDPYSLYFHVPFCNKKCPYCHFYVVLNNEKAKDSLLRGFFLELEQKKPLFEKGKLVSIYFGGGTPFLFGPEYLSQVIKALNPPLDTEITLEANPDDVTFEAMQQMKNAGFNRISLGVQSLDNTCLKTLGRTHSAQKAIEAIHAAHDAGFDNISIDLMYDIPNQTTHSFNHTLSQLSSLPITHLSLYNLTIEPYTPFFKKRNALIPTLPSDEDSLTMLTSAINALENWGFERYEISAFAKKGYSSRHNLGYWQGRPFLGLGPSAFSYWDKKRFSNVANLKEYMQALEVGRSPMNFTECLDPPHQVQELIAVGIRVLKGIDITPFTPLSSSLEKSIASLLEQGLIHKTENILSLSERGTLFYDTVAEHLI